MIHLENGLITCFNGTVIGLFLEYRLIVLVVCIILLHFIRKVVIDRWNEKKCSTFRNKCFDECLKKSLNIDSISKKGSNKSSNIQSPLFENVVFIQEGTTGGSNDNIFAADLSTSFPNACPKVLFWKIQYSSINNIRYELETLRKGTKSMIFLEGYKTKLKRFVDDEVFHNLLINISEIVGLGSILIFDYNSIRLEKETFVENLYSNVFVDILYSYVIERIWTQKFDRKEKNQHHKYLRFFLRDTCWHLQDIIINENILNVAILEKLHIHNEQAQIQSRALKNENIQLNSVISSLKREKFYHAHIVQEIHNKFLDISLNLSSTKKENKKLKHEVAHLRVKLDKANQTISLFETEQNEKRKLNVVGITKSKKESDKNNGSKTNFTYKTRARGIQHITNTSEEANKVKSTNKERKVIQKSRDHILHRGQQKNHDSIFISILPSQDKEFLKRCLFLLSIIFMLLFNLFFAMNFESINDLFDYKWWQVSNAGCNGLLHNLRKECNNKSVPILNAITTIFEPHNFSKISSKKHHVHCQSSYDASLCQQLENTKLNSPDILKDNTSIISLKDMNSMFRPHQNFVSASKPARGNLFDTLNKVNTTKVIPDNSNTSFFSDSLSKIFDIHVSKTQHSRETNWNHHILSRNKSNINKKKSKLCSPKHKISYRVQAMQPNFCFPKRQNFLFNKNHDYSSDSSIKKKSTILHKSNAKQKKSKAHDPIQVSSEKKVFQKGKKGKNKITTIIDSLLRPFRAFYRLIRSLIHK